MTRKIYNSMDIIFFEDQSYYPKTNIQGESMTESQICESIQISQPLLPDELITTTNPPIPPTGKFELCVYTRRNKLSEQPHGKSQEVNHPNQLLTIEDTQTMNEINHQCTKHLIENLNFVSTQEETNLVSNTMGKVMKINHPNQLLTMENTQIMNEINH